MKKEERRCRVCDGEEETQEHVLTEYPWRMDKVGRREMVKDEQQYNPFKENNEK